MTSFEYLSISDPDPARSTSFGDTLFPEVDQVHNEEDPQH